MVLLGCSLLYLITFMFMAYKSQVYRFTFAINYAVLILLFGLSFAITAYNIEPLPNAGWDLAEHHNLIDLMRLEGTMKVEFANTAYYTEPFTVLLHYIVSLLPSNNFFKFITIFAEFVVLSILGRKMQKEKQMGGSALCLYFILIFSLCPIYQYVSGVRTVLATSFFCAAIYRDLYFKKRDAVMILLYISALFFHTFTIVVVLLRFVFLFKKIMWKGRILLLFWGAGLVPIMIFFIKLGDFIPLFHGFSSLVGYYGRIGNISRIASYITKYDFFRIGVIFLLLIISEVERKHMLQNNNKGIAFMSFYTILCYFSIGSLAVYHLFDRMCVVLAWGSLLAICYLFMLPRSKHYKCRIMLHFFLCVECGILFLFNIRHMTVFSHLGMR